MTNDKIQHNHKPLKPSAAVLEALMKRYMLDPGGRLIAAETYRSRGGWVLKGAIAGSVDRGTGYAKVLMTCPASGKRHRMKRSHVVWYLTNKEWPHDIIDHINCDRGDDRPENLRQVTHRQNMRGGWSSNREGSSAYRGVSYDSARGKWKARTQAEKQISLGFFDNEHAAALAFNIAAEPLGYAEEALNAISEVHISEAILGLQRRVSEIEARAATGTNAIVRYIFLDFLPLAMSGDDYSVDQLTGALLSLS